MQENQQITFLSDREEAVRHLQVYLSPEAEHLLDWCHVTMRLTVLKQMARGLPPNHRFEDEYRNWTQWLTPPVVNPSQEPPVRNR